MERKSFKWMIVDLMFMYIVTGLGLILMAFLMEKFQLNGTFVEVGVTVIYVVSGIAGGLIAVMLARRFGFIFWASTANEMELPVVTTSGRSPITS
mgnify:FL=1